jgi:hypothetical protein
LPGWVELFGGLMEYWNLGRVYQEWWEFECGLVFLVISIALLAAEFFALSHFEYSLGLIFY